jgi:hypothetical protein
MSDVQLYRSVICGAVFLLALDVGVARATVSRPVVRMNLII